MNSNSSKPARKLGRSLLATTCLTVASGTAAVAGTISEPPDFPFTANGTLLPAGTDTVNGFIGQVSENNFDFTDWFEFQGLGSGTFTLKGSGDLGSDLAFEVDTDGGSTLNSGLLPVSSPGVLATGAIPADGKLVVGMFANNESGSGHYTVTLETQSAVPEPSTLVPAGLALAGALAWRRKRSQ